ncbi:hypothetical protein MTO96_041956, partial [Rhipicephalus appendiculatus]
MTPTDRTPLFFGQLLVMAYCPCGAVMNASATATATRAYRFSDAMAGPLSFFREASSARLVGDTMSLRPWDPPSTRLPFDDIADQWLRPSRTTFAGLSPASDPGRQRLCPVPAASPARPLSLLRMLRPGPHTLNFSPRDSICINHRDIIAAFSGFGSTVAMTPTDRTPLFFAQ